MRKVLLSLGSNMGCSEQIIKSALLDLAAIDGIKIDKVSSLYRTKPEGFLNQRDFINAALSVMTSLDTYDLLTKMQALELKYKRVRLFKNGPRTLDIDIIASGNEVILSDNLIIPHPRFQDRAFVLVPLDEIVPEFIMPNFNLSVHDLKRRLSNDQLSEVTLIHAS